MNLPIFILGLVTAQRLAELLIARRNTAALLARGAHEASPGHYRWIVLLHGAWLVSLWLLAPGQPIVWPWLLLFFMLQAGRVWVLATLGPRWTTRIIVLPGAPLVTTGPFRFVRHPNYLIVAGEIAALPLAFGLWPAALVFSLPNAAILYVRIRAEEAAWAGYKKSPF